MPVRMWYVEVRIVYVHVRNVGVQNRILERFAVSLELSVGNVGIVAGAGIRCHTCDRLRSDLLGGCTVQRVSDSSLHNK